MESAPLKLALLGESGVGKTNLLLRAVDDSFSHEFSPTMSLDCRSIEVQYCDSAISARLWDTAGDERYDSLMPAHLHGADGVLLVYNIADQFSFEKLPKWINYVKGSAPEYAKCMIVGAQSDRESERVVDTGKGKGFAEARGMGFIETSAATGENVQEMIREIVKTVMEGREGQTVATVVPPNVGDSTSRSSSWWCC
jgi:small GTP-binding protein